MSTTRRFKVEATPGFHIVLDVDTQVMTPAMAEEVNGYLPRGEQCLKLADGDPIRAIALRAAVLLLRFLFNGPSATNALFSLSSLGYLSGWPRRHGITISEFEVPSLTPDALEIIEESTR